VDAEHRQVTTKTSPCFLLLLFPLLLFLSRNDCIPNINTVIHQTAVRIASLTLLITRRPLMQTFAYTETITSINR
jgi:hypothetical protein